MNACVLRAPEPYRTIMAQVLANDRAYFARPPAAPQRVRPYVHGECWPHIPQPGVQAFVRIEREGTGTLHRQLLRKTPAGWAPFPDELLLVQEADDLGAE